MTVLLATGRPVTAIAAQRDFEDNNWLDQFRIPVGDWFTQTVDWVDENLEWLLNAVQWPFEFLFDLIMNDNPARDSIMSISWVWVVLGFFLLASVLRNTRVGLMSAVMVAACGFLGQDFWFQTSKTFGMIFVSVLLCTLVGLPLGILCGRSDAVWSATRPILDAMQVVHSFVWMLPFIAFWGTGEVSSTMVTMLFALPPMVRLTNLGIRQVPDDVVEASRSFGASERRVLTDVQIPLARPAIMTGLNQTLLLAISMLGIAAFMGADGLGKLIFRAINNLDTGLAASAGLAFFFVAVVLDRISQPEADDGLSLFGRIGQAWRLRADPEALLAEQAQNAADAADTGLAVEEPAEPAERPFPVESKERTGLMVVAFGSIVAAVGAFLPWAADGGPVSAWGRVADEDLASQMLTGVSGSGGSFFGIAVVACAALAALAALRPLMPSSLANLSKPINRLQGIGLAVIGAALVLIFILNLLDVNFDVIESAALVAFAAIAVLVVIDTWVRGTPRLGADGALVMALATLGTAVGFASIRGPFGVSYSLQFGLFVTLAGAAVATIGGLLALRAAPYLSQRPLPTSRSNGGAAGAIAGMLVVLGGSYAAWVVDERGGFRNRQFFKGMSVDGPGLGWPTFAFAVAAMLTALVVVGVFGLKDQRRWHWGTLTTGLALPAIIIPAAFTMSISRTGDTDYFNDANALTGAGVLISVIGGFVLFTIGRSAIKHFARRKIYAGVGASAATALVLNAEAELQVGDETGADVLEGSNL